MTGVDASPARKVTRPRRPLNGSLADIRTRTKKMLSVGIEEETRTHGRYQSLPPMLPRQWPPGGFWWYNGGTAAISLISLLVGPHNAPPFISSEEASLTGTSANAIHFSTLWCEKSSPRLWLGPDTRC